MKKLCCLWAKTLINSNDTLESDENGISTLPPADIVHIKPVKLDKDKPDVQASNCSSQQTSQGNISNLITPARIESPFFSQSILQPWLGLKNSEKNSVCFTWLINLVNFQLTQ